jgi:hypothetical protein
MAQAPNEQSFVEQCKTTYPSAWAKCLAPDDDGEFIRLVARDLHNTKTDRWGLNAKRDGPSSDISKDVLAYYIGPTDRHVECYDVIGAHESSAARVVWNDITNYDTIGNPGTARYVDPIDGGGYSGGGVVIPPGPTPVPVYTVNEALNYLTSAKGSPLSGAEVQQAINRARELGWDGGPTIAQSIVHQIATEMFSNPPDTVLDAQLTLPFGIYPVGTPVRIVVG